MKMVENPEKSQGHAFNVGNPDNNIKVSDLAEMMINMYSEITGKPKGTTRTVSGVEYYGPGYEDSDLRIPSMRLKKRSVVDGRFRRGVQSKVPADGRNLVVNGRKVAPA